MKWDGKKRRYLDAAGRAVSPQKVRRSVEEATAKASERLSAIAEEYRRGRINAAEWFIQTRDELSGMHTALGMIAHGGKSQMSPARWGTVGQRVRYELDFLRRARARLLSTDVASLGDDFAAKMGMHALAGNRSYEEIVRRREREAGVTHVIRHMTPGDNCDGCKAAKGEYSIESVPPIGEQDCLSRCNCWLEYVEGETEQKPKTVNVRLQNVERGEGRTIQVSIGEANG